MLKINHERCMHCGGCVGICPFDALSLEEVRLSVDKAKCTDCGVCTNFCPVRALGLEK